LSEQKVSLVIHAVGDIAPKRIEPASIFKSVASRISDADILFGQMECTLSTRGLPAPNAKLAMRTDPSVASALRDTGFHVMSLAGNHSLDFGAIALLDSLEHLKASNIKTCGAGANIAEARRPAIQEVGNLRIAFLAYSSILPAGYAAEAQKPGCSSMRAFTHYEQVEPDQPGTPARIHTFPDPADLRTLLADIKAAREMADFVAVSMHWGIHFVRASVADYQRTIAYAAIDHGADMIIGHHPHLLKGVEIYAGRPIFYSLGNFAIEQPSAFKADVHLDKAFSDISQLSAGWKPGERYMAPPETRYTLIARCALKKVGPIVIYCFPCWIDDDSIPQLLEPADPLFAEVLEYLRAISREAGLKTRYERCGNAVIISSE
jgi:hypothetical protein